jgi:N-acetylneuraminic acid mutarotase
LGDAESIRHRACDDSRMRLALASLPLCAVAACGGSPSSPPPDLGSVPDLAASPTWQERRPLPVPRQETAVVALDGRVVVIGGFDRTATIVDTVEAYDPSTDEWTTLPRLPRPLHHINAAVAGGAIWIVGALERRGADLFAATGVMLSYEPGATSWRDRGTMPAGTERGASFVAAIGDRIYVAGGLRSGADVADFSLYEITADRWTMLPPLPSARDHGVGAAVAGRFYAIGGRGVSIGGHVTRVDVFDPAMNAWSTAAPMPTSRGGMAAAVVGERILVAGGEGNGAVASGVFDAVELFDPGADRWTVLPPMRTPRHGTGAAAVGSRVYVPGGADVQAFGAVATLEVIEIR